MKPRLLLISMAILGLLTLRADNTPIPETIELPSFSVTFKEPDRFAWHVQVFEKDARICYKYAAFQNKYVAEFHVFQICIDQSLRGLAPRELADQLIMSDKANFKKIAYADERVRIGYDENTDLESPFGSLLFYRTGVGYTVTRNAEKNNYTYAAVVLPDDYASRGIVYIFAAHENNDRKLDLPAELEKFQTLIAGLKEKN